jgi:hypothetical protein
VTRVELLRLIRRAAKRTGTSVRFVRPGSEHELWMVGDVVVPIPRQRELTVGVARSIERDLERVLGPGWWMR